MKRIAQPRLKGALAPSRGGVKSKENKPINAVGPSEVREKEREGGSEERGRREGKGGEDEQYLFSLHRMNWSQMLLNLNMILNLKSRYRLLLHVLSHS